MNKTVESLRASVPKVTYEFGRALPTNFEKWLPGKFGDRKFEVYPNVYQNSDSFRDFRFELYQELRPIVERVNSFEFSSATQLLGEMGQGCSHLLLPFSNAEVLRENFKLTKPTGEELDDFRILIREILDNAEFASIAVKDKSSSGYYSFIKGVGYKLSIAGEIIPRIQEILRVCKAQDYAGLVKIMGCEPLFTLGVRYQLDGIKRENGISSVIKERMWYSPEFINTDGVSGEQGIIDYSVYNESGYLDNRFCAARVRSMYALSYNYNVLMQILNNYLVSGLKKVAPEINFSTATNAVEELGGFTNSEFITIDYGNYGETIPGECVEIICEELDRKIPGYGSLLRVTYNAARLCRGYERNVNDPFILNDGAPFRKITSGLCSGHGLVAFIGKVCAVWDARIVFKKLIGRSFKPELHMRNLYPSYKRKTSSDDGIAKFSDTGLEKEYRENISKLSIFKTSITDSPEFLGNLYLKDYVTRDLSKLCGHLTNFERGMRSKMFFELGIGCSIREYTNNRFFSEVYPILRKHFKLLKIDLNNYLSMAETVATPTAIFLSNPDSIFYKLDPKLVNEGIYKKFFQNISKDFIIKHIEGCINA